jgi:hypothetical protein
VPYFLILLWWTVLLAQWPTGTITILVALGICGVAIAIAKERRGPPARDAQSNPGRQASNSERTRARS